MPDHFSKDMGISAGFQLSLKNHIFLMWEVELFTRTESRRHYAFLDRKHYYKVVHHAGAGQSSNCQSAGKSTLKPATS